MLPVDAMWFRSFPCLLCAAKQSLCYPQIQGLRTRIMSWYNWNVTELQLIVKASLVSIMWHISKRDEKWANCSGFDWISKRWDWLSIHESLENPIDAELWRAVVLHPHPLTKSRLIRGHRAREKLTNETLKVGWLILENDCWYLMYVCLARIDYSSQSAVGEWKGGALRMKI